MDRFNQPHSSTPLATIIPVSDQEASLTKPKFAKLPFDETTPGKLVENASDPELKQLSAVSLQESGAAPIAEEFDESTIDARADNGRRRGLRTGIEWVKTFAQAADEANRHDKLVFVVHAPGNFAIDGLTCENGQAFRTGTLSDPRVGRFFAEHFVAIHQQVGDLRIERVNGRLANNDGDVVSYFCTPTGRVVNMVVGLVGPRKLWHEAKWAIETYRRAVEQPLAMQLDYVANMPSIAS